MQLDIREYKTKGGDKKSIDLSILGQALQMGKMNPFIFHVSVDWSAQKETDFTKKIGQEVSLPVSARVLFDRVSLSSIEL